MILNIDFDKSGILQSNFAIENLTNLIQTDCRYIRQDYANKSAQLSLLF